MLRSVTALNVANQPPREPIQKKSLHKGDIRGHEPHEGHAVGLGFFIRLEIKIENKSLIAPRNRDFQNLSIDKKGREIKSVGSNGTLTEENIFNKMFDHISVLGYENKETNKQTNKNYVFPNL